jgi:hypothetical protein
VTRLHLVLVLAVVAMCAAALGHAGPAAGNSAAGTVTATSALDASSNDECFRCHGSADAKGTTIAADGRHKSNYVNREVYES